MADKNPREDNLAVAVHQAEHAYQLALQAPAGQNRAERINKAANNLSATEQAYSDCRTGIGYTARIR